MVKPIKIALALFVFSFLFCSIGIIESNKHAYIFSRGNYFFNNTRQSNNVAQVLLKFADGQTIHLSQKNGLWYVKEADDYFASFSKIDSLFKLLRETTIYRADTIDKEQLTKIMQNSMQVRILDDRGNVIDEALIASKSEKNKYHYATINDNVLLYQISGNYAISSVVMDWIQPLEQIDVSQIGSIVTENFNVYRQHSFDTFKHAKDQTSVIYIERLTQVLKSFPLFDVRHSVNFDYVHFPKIKHFDITLLNGIIYQLNLYSDGQEFWISIKLGQKKLISADVSNFLEERNLLFDGWFFKIDKDVGESLQYFAL